LESSSFQTPHLYTTIADFLLCESRGAYMLIVSTQSGDFARNITILNTRLNILRFPRFRGRELFSVENHATTPAHS
jgi:hypothetical protein